MNRHTARWSNYEPPEYVRRREDECIATKSTQLSDAHKRLK
ncbi:hypothetical protein [Nostoc sp. ChiQUE01b]|nr:hypothetical protein [Nostoc sp. ChiQUE01b]MDZ8260966.1 hypothetical protein [Nostoc sp. ChiQUE01b]